MPFAPASLVIEAVKSLEGAHPLAVVTIPALLRAAHEDDVDPVAVGAPFGSTEESALLDDYSRLPRPPDPDRPWRAPWSTKEPWQKRKYPGGALQRLRTDASGRGRVLIQSKPAVGAAQSRHVWRLTPQAGSELMSTATYTQVRIVDLALWFGRTQDVPDLYALVAWFNELFAPDQADLIGTLYSDEIPEAYLDKPFEAAPIGDDTYQQLGSLPPAPTVDKTLEDLVISLEARLRASGFELASDNLVRRVLTAWLGGDFVVLVGQPGTGKTMFAGLLGRAMEAELGLDAPLLIPVRSDFDEAEFIGYERLGGGAQLRDFAREILKTDKPLEAKVVVLEEFNLAQIETYMAAILVAAQEQERLVRLPAGEHGQLPIDTFFIATCNSYRDEPETRTRVSAPTKRRSTIITMPNILGDRFDSDPIHAIRNLTMTLISNESRKVQDRLTAQRGAQFDGLRAAALLEVTDLSHLSAFVLEALDAVCGSILGTAVGRSWFTMGLLRDVVIHIALAKRDEESELEALGQAVADKLLHQARGSQADIQDLRGACAALPNADEIERLIERMLDGPSDEILPLL